MVCPYCGIGISAKWDEWYSDCYPVPNDEGYYDKGYKILSGFCPDCEKIIIRLQHGGGYETFHSSADLRKIYAEELIYPKFPIPKQIHEYVPQGYRDVYTESAQVNIISPRASATLSRYLLQMLLHEELKIKKRTLEEEISELETMPNIPSTLVAMLQIMRKVANFGAHPKKSTNSGEIVEIEKGESEIMLQLIEELLDFVFVKPKQQEEFLTSVSAKYNISLNS